MTQEQKYLVLKDLCARLPYGVAVKFKVNEVAAIEEKFTYVVNGEYSYITNGKSYLTLDIIKALFNNHLDEIKPYLFPLSSMTNELWDKEFMGYGITEFTRDSFKYGCETLEFNNDNPHLSSMVRFINQLIKNHFDIYGLIPMGLAEDATGKNIY